jgi:hypothetical protein
MKVTKLLALAMIITAAVLMQACGGSKTPAPPPPQQIQSPAVASGWTKVSMPLLIRECKPGEASENIGFGVYRAFGMAEALADLGLNSLQAAIDAADASARAQLAASFGTTIEGVLNRGTTLQGVVAGSQADRNMRGVFNNAAANAFMVCANAEEGNGRFRVSVMVETKVNPNDLDRALGTTGAGSPGRQVQVERPTATSAPAGASGTGDTTGQRLLMEFDRMLKRQ